MKCENCEQEHDGSYGSGRFCSSKCARGFSTKEKRQEINRKVSEKLTGIYVKGNGQRLAHEDVCITCLYCGVEFYVTFPKRKRKFCSSSCGMRMLNDTTDMASKGGKASVNSQKRRSKNEIYFADLCKERFRTVLTNEPIFDGWDSDIIIEDIRVAVLWNGKWHYEKIGRKHSVKQVQNRDKIKVKKIEECGYTAYIIKDMGKYNPLFVQQEFDKFVGLWCKG